MTSTHTVRAPAQLSLDAVLLVAAIGLGSLVRLIPVLSTDFPLNDGGLFAAMIDDLVMRGPFPPDTVQYNAGDLPFAYPPLGLYLGAGLVAIGVPTLEVLRFVPVALSIATIPAWFLLARELVGVRSAAIATVVFALLPRSYEWLVAGGGLTRAAGVLLVLLALWLIVRYQLRGRISDGAFGGMLLGAAALSHLEAGAFGAVTAVLLVFVCGGPMRRIVVVGSIAAVSTIPWIAYVVSANGFEPLMSAGGSRIDRYPAVVRWFLGLRFTQEAYIPLGAILGAVGQFLAATSRRAWIPLWCLLIAAAIPGAAATYLMLPWSLGASIALTSLIVPRLAPRIRPAVLGSGLAIMLVASAWSSHGESPHLRSVSTDVRTAMAWVVSDLDPDTKTIVVSGIHGQQAL